MVAEAALISIVEAPLAAAVAIGPASAPGNLLLGCEVGRGIGLG